MTLDDAIKHANEVAEKLEKDAEACDYWTDGEGKSIEKCRMCASEHIQLAKWLEELKWRREVPVRLKEQISILRSKIKSLSTEYEKGFMSALSATESMIATLEQEENND